MFEIEPVYDSEDNGAEDKDNVIAEPDRTDFNLTMTKIFNVLKKHERTYTTIFCKNDKIKLKLMNVGGTTVINKSASDIDLWNLPRIEKEFLRLLEENLKSKVQVKSQFKTKAK